LTVECQFLTGINMTNPEFLSTQIDKSSYYYLNLTARPDGPLSVVCGGWEHCLPDYEMRRSTFRYRGFEFVAAGRGELRIGRKTVPLIPGMVFSYGPGIAHRIRTDPDHPMTKYFIDFTGAEAKALVEATAIGRRPILVADPGRVRTMLDMLHQVADEGGPLAETTAVLLLRAILLMADALARNPTNMPSQAELSYDRCRRCIDERFLELKGLSDLAAACHMDPATVCRLFKRFGQATPYQVLLRRKMNHAASRLQLSEILVKEIAAEVGYDDPFHFSRAFKRVHGISPQEFREHAARSIPPDR